MKRLVRVVTAIGLVVGLAIQLVPYGRDHTNPPVVNEPQWASFATRQLAVSACFDCHSNETQWPWYSNIAPMSWLIRRDVDRGRDELNWSEFDGDGEGEDAVESIQDGSMPPPQYQLLHSGARLTDEEMDQLVAGLNATFGNDEEGDSSGRGSGDSESSGSRHDDDPDE